jgi:hypothetical protein
LLVHVFLGQFSKSSSSQGKDPIRPVLHDLLRSLARITKLYLDSFGEFSNPKPFSIFIITSLYAISWFRSTNRA